MFYVKIVTDSGLKVNYFNKTTTQKNLRMCSVIQKFENCCMTLKPEKEKLLMSLPFVVLYLAKSLVTISLTGYVQIFYY